LRNSRSWKYRTREIYQNDTDFTSKGSLMWILNKTVTKFGSRLLRSWVGRPLMDMV
jgi:DNA mismatch repair protein MSH3